MGDILLATLRLNANRVITLTTNTGLVTDNDTGTFPTMLSDGNNATKEYEQAVGDSIDPGNGSVRVEADLSASGLDPGSKISKVVITLRNQMTGGGSVIQHLSINGIDRDALTVGGAATDRVVTLATDPETGAAWLVSAFSTKKFGWNTAVTSVDENTAVEGRTIDYKVDVYGPDTQTVTAGRADGAGAALAPAAQQDWPNPLPLVTGAGTPLPDDQAEVIGARLAAGFSVALPDYAQAVARGYSIRTKATPYPYFAFTQRLPLAPLGTGSEELTYQVTFALYRMPIMKASPDEVHPLYCIYESTTGQELVYIGVSPSGRLIAKTQLNPELRSAPGVVRADGAFRTATLWALRAGTRYLSLDNQLVQVMSGPAVSDFIDSPNPRLMLFNNPHGATRCECAIRYAFEGDAGGIGTIYWLIDEGTGSATDGFNGVLGPPRVPEDPNGDYHLDAEWHDPSKHGFPLLWGAVPWQPVQFGFRWQRQGEYSSRGAPATSYTSRSGGGET